MQFHKRFSFMAALGILVASVLFSGCTTQERNITPGRQNVNPTPGITAPEVPGNDVGLRNGTLPGDNRGNLVGFDSDRMPQTLDTRQNNADVERARAIEAQVKQMPQVSDANCVVNNNRAVVAYTPKENAGDTAAVKNAIISQVKKQNPNITDVAVSEDANVLDQVRRMADDLINGRAMDKFQQDFKQLMDQINRVVRQ